MSVDLKEKSSISTKLSSDLTLSSIDLNNQNDLLRNEQSKEKPISVTVTSSEIWEKNKKFTVYKLVVNCGERNWKVYHRYNEFNQLNESLKKRVPGYNLKLPGKKLFGNNFSSDFIRNRRQGLENFVQRIITDKKLLINPDVQSFFRLDNCKTDSDNKNNSTSQVKKTIDSSITTSSSSATSSSGSGSTSEPDDTLSFECRWANDTNSSGNSDTVNSNSDNNNPIKEIVNLGPSERLSSKPSDFEFLKVIGKGSFGKVLSAKLRSDAKMYAVKVLQKKMIIKRNEKKHIMCERNVLLKNLNHPFLVGLHYSFQTRDKLYFVLDYVNGGELFFHLQRETCFTEPRARFYAAEMTSALGYLHSQGIVYRDLKPENILLDSDGHIVLTDFGLCKDGLRERETTTTFCGTPEYLAPEVLRKEAYDKCVDWWCLGAVLYEMLYGLPPFYSRDTAEMYDNILHKPVRLRTNISLAARNLLECLLEKDKHKRLGAKNDASDLKAHDFFKPINWSDLESKKISPPFNPNVKGNLDLKNIDPEFTREPVPASVCRSNGFSVSSIPENAFQGFSYAASLKISH